MKKILLSIVAAFVVLIPSCACEPSPLEDAAKVYPMGVVKHDFTPSPTTTTTTTTTLPPTTTTHYHPPTTTTTSPPTPQPTGDIWWKLAGCETGYKYDNPNTGNGYYGYFQFSLSTWQGVGGPGYPHHHSYDTQLHYAKILQARDGWRPWPACARRLGLL